MRIPNKWVALAIAHLVVFSCLTVGVILIALRLGEPAETAKQAVASLPTSPPSDAEIARLHLLSARIDVMQNNLANAETVAFKRQHVNIEDRAAKISEYQLDMTQGALEATNQNTDLAIQGEGFFHVKVRPTLADGTAYTRIGMLRRNRDGKLVVDIGDGYELIPPIYIPLSAMNLAVDQDGTVTYTSMTYKKVTVGPIKLCQFANEQELGRADGLYTETYASGPPVTCNPGDNGAGQLQQGYLESSNVDAVKEWAALLRAQQMLQFSSQAVQISAHARQAMLMATKATSNGSRDFN